MKAQQDQIGQHKATIDQLFQAQLADPEDVQTSAYVEGDAVLRKLGQGADGSYSWARIHLTNSRRHVRRISAELGSRHGNESPQGGPIGQDLPLSTFATQEVSKYMMRNAHMVKMTGTVYSRIVEMREELETRRAEDDSFKEDLLIPMEDILEF